METAVETMGGPVAQDDVTRTASIEEPARVEAPAPEVRALVPPPAPVPVDKVEPPRKVVPVREHHIATGRATLRVMRVARTAVKQRVVFVRVAVKQRPAKTPGVRRVLWTNATPQ